MDLIKVKDEIMSRIDILAKMRKEIRTRAEAKAQSAGAYDKKLATVLIGLENGIEFSVFGETVKNPKAATIEKIARGICFEEKITAERDEALYKALISNIEAVKAELNGLQSILRNLEEV